jgi:glucose-1-phosphate cytidylyltransferase
MKVVILAGGLGTRLAEETDIVPKPMVEIGGRPILWHIMKHYAYYGFNEFYVALGYKGDVIKRYFMDYTIFNSNVTINLKLGQIDVERPESDNWKIHLIDTGLNTMTGGRIKRLADDLQDETFMLTYGDGVSNIDLHALLDFHRTKGCIATVSAVRPPARFGSLTIDDDGHAYEFKEKVDTGWISGGFFVFEPTVLDYLPDDKSVMEIDALGTLATQKQLAAYKHDKFWQCMDTLRDKRYLESLWETKKAAWKVWQE